MTQHTDHTIADVRDLVKSYPTAAGDVTVLHHINLKIEPGEFVGITGPSGSGKSTLLNMIAGIDTPTSGELFVCGQAVHQANQDQLARWRGRKVGIVFQFFQLLPTLTLLENVMLPMEFTRLCSRQVQRQQALDLLAQVNIDHLAHKLPSTVSGGEQQRTAIARALATDPPLVVADEPTGNLDTANANEVMRLFENLVAHGKTVVIVTHDPDLTSRIPRVIRLRDGYIMEDANGKRRRIGRGKYFFMSHLHLQADRR